jgi:hypothetical protein
MGKRCAGSSPKLTASIARFARSYPGSGGLERIWADPTESTPVSFHSRRGRLVCTLPVRRARPRLCWSPHDSRV